MGQGMETDLFSSPWPPSVTSNSSKQRGRPMANRATDMARSLQHDGCHLGGLAVSPPPPLPRKGGREHMVKIRGFAPHRRRWFALMEGVSVTAWCSSKSEGDLLRVLSGKIPEMRAACQAKNTPTVGNCPG